MSQACMTSYDHPDRWDGSPSTQYEWSTQHSFKIPVEIVYSSLTVVKIRLFALGGSRALALLSSEHGAVDGVRVWLPCACS